MKNKTILPTIAAILTNVIFGFSFLFSTVALRHAHPLLILQIRFTVAFAVLNLLWLLGILKLDFKGKSKRRILCMAVAQPLLYYVFELYGIELTSSAISGVIISLVPVAVLLMSTVFLKEKPTRIQVAFSLLSLASVSAISLMSDNGAKSSALGVILLLGAVICASVFNILSRRESKEYSPVERTYIMFGLGCIGYNIISPLVIGNSYLSELSGAAQSAEFWFSIIYLGIISSIVAFLLYNYSTTYISSVRSASFSNLITVVSVFAGIFILQEQLSIPQIICSALIIIGVFGVNK